MHNGMQYDPIQGKGHGHEPFKVGNPSIFKCYLLRHLQWELAFVHWVGIVLSLHPCAFVFDIAIFVLKRDHKLTSV